MFKQVLVVADFAPESDNLLLPVGQAFDKVHTLLGLLLQCFHVCVHVFEQVVVQLDFVQLPHSVCAILDFDHTIVQLLLDEGQDDFGRGVDNTGAYFYFFQKFIFVFLLKALLQF